MVVVVVVVVVVVPHYATKNPQVGNRGTRRERERVVWETGKLMWKGLAQEPAGPVEDRTWSARVREPWLQHPSGTAALQPFPW